MTDDAPDDAVPHAGPGDPVRPAEPAVEPADPPSWDFPEVAAPEAAFGTPPDSDLPAAGLSEPDSPAPADSAPEVAAAEGVTPDGAPEAPAPEAPERVTPEPAAPDVVSAEVVSAEVSEPDVVVPPVSAPESAAPEAPAAERAAPTVPPVTAALPVPPAEEPAYQAPVEAPVAAPVARHVRKKEGTSFLRELPVLVVIAFVLALLIKHFLVQAFYIPSGSMEQTLQVGDRVLVNKVPYLYRGPHRGEVVVFNGLDNFDEGVTFTEPGNPIAKALRKVNSTIGLGAPDEKDYIKRVIGVAGDRVMCCDADGHVVVTPEGGKATSLDETYLYDDDQSGTRYFCDAVAKGAAASQQTCPPGSLGVLVPEGRLWVMGDHRGNSSDSRFHITDEHQGTVPEDKVVGKAFTVVYPFGHAGLLHVPDTFSSVALSAEPFVLGAVGVLPLALLRRRRR